MSREANANIRTPVRFTSETLVDLTDTSRSAFITGIQRVAGESSARWRRLGSVVEVGWGPHGRLTQLESPHRALIPWEGSYVLPEIATERSRVSAISSVAQFSRSRTLAIGFDTIPITTAETAGVGMPAAFAYYLTAIARFDVVVPISASAEVEYTGWRRMLAGAGIPGPAIRRVDLPFAVGVPDPDARAAVGLGPHEAFVLAVGSHEPRKNHLRVLEAAESLWAAGRRFTLVMVGGNAWKTERFDALVATLRRRGRRVVLVRSTDDATLWGLYRSAQVSVFPSINEGFGLPLAESLISGTPVVTSDYGSMADLGRDRGALLADPRDSRSIAAALADILDDPAERGRLASEAARVRSFGWDQYADAVISELGIRTRGSTDVREGA